MSKFDENLSVVMQWFDLKNYAPLAGFGLREWGEQIVKRALILKALDQLLELGSDSPMSKLQMDLVAEQIELLKIDPLGKWFFNDGEPPIYPISLADMDRIVSVGGKFNLAKDIPVDSFVGSEVNFLGHIRVNLAARDADIRAAFDTWLEQRRRDYNFDLAKRAIRKVAINEWLKAKMIPFADLLIWERFSGLKLTEERRIGLLFPNFEGDSRDQHQTTKKAFTKNLTLANGFSLVFSKDRE